ncbi:MAG TPA: J domain-containing protein [Candidatus Limnocylindrales bacterium]|nr:J domain-containing protein [Candidatus Limnocylindrales bacterium]
MPPRHIVPNDDLYARLEVQPDASYETIEIAWRALLKRHHPDIAGATALETAKRINVAHDWLSDPELRSRYDEERGAARVAARARRRAWGPNGGPDGGAPPGPAGRPPVRRAAPLTTAQALRRFLDRVARLDRTELDRLSIADATSIAFVASISRFLAPDAAAALEAIDAEVRQRLPPRDWADPGIRDSILAAAHEIALRAFLDEHLSEPFRGRARDRLMRGWEAAIDQPRYGPNTAAVERFVRRVGRLDEDEVDALVGAIRGRIPPDPWPRGLDPDENDGLRVSSALAGRDGVEAAAPLLSTLDRATASRAARLLRRTAHALVLRHAFAAADFASLLAPWHAATSDPGTGRRDEARAEATVRRR